MGLTWCLASRPFATLRVSAWEPCGQLSLPHPSVCAPASLTPLMGRSLGGRSDREARNRGVFSEALPGGVRGKNAFLLVEEMVLSALLRNGLAAGSEECCSFVLLGLHCPLQATKWAQGVCGWVSDFLKKLVSNSCFFLICSWVGKCGCGCVGVSALCS